MTIIRDAVDRLEVSLADMRKQLTVARTSDLTDIKNHLTSLCDTAVQSSMADSTVTQIIGNVSSVIRETCNMDNFETSVQHATEVLVNKVALNVEHVSSKLEDHLEAMRVSLSEVCAKEFPASEILREVKYLSDAVAAMQFPETAHSNNSHQLTLADELAEDLALARSHLDEPLEVDSGWRLLGAKKVWKSDWTAYDLRQLRRRQQEKAAQKARNRRKSNKKNNYNNNNGHINQINNINNTNNNRSNTNTNHKTTSINNRTNNNNNSNHDNNNYNFPTCSYVNYNNNNHNCNNNNKNSNNNIIYNNNKNNSNNKINSFLPPDKDLLAAAKVAFSRPPTDIQRGIRFQRGSILNPYPVDHQFPQAQPTSTPDWILSPALRNSFSQHCSSCSCECSSFH